MGRWSSGVSWSTVKVPLAIAALQVDRRRAEPLAVRAITESDNVASEQLWSLLGEPAAAAQQVQAVIAATGDSATVVESQRLRKGFTPFGQTLWSLAGQAQFAANLAQVPGAATVIDLMQQLIPEHQWGLAARSVAAKGGWGPGTRDGYLVRQFAIVPVRSGNVGVALAAEAATFDAGVDAVNIIAEWLFGQLESDGGATTNG